MSFTYSVQTTITVSTDGSDTIFPIDLSIAPMMGLSLLSKEFDLIKPKPVAVIQGAGFPGSTATINGHVVTVTLATPPPAGFTTLGFYLQYTP